MRESALALPQQLTELFVTRASVLTIANELAVVPVPSLVAERLTLHPSVAGLAKTLASLGVARIGVGRNAVLATVGAATTKNHCISIKGSFYLGGIDVLKAGCTNCNMMTWHTALI